MVRRTKKYLRLQRFANASPQAIHLPPTDFSTILVGKPVDKLVARSRNRLARAGFSRRLLLGSGVMALSSSHQSRDEGAEEGFAAAPGVVDELEEAEIQR